VAHGIFNLNFIQDSTVVKFDEESITDGTLLRVVIVDAEAFVFDAMNLGTKDINTRVSRRGVSTVNQDQEGYDNLNRICKTH